MRQTERVSQASGAHKNCGSLFYINTKKTENFLGEKLQKKKKKKKKKKKRKRKMKIILIKATQVLICRKFEIF